jgi:hypothetical protein
MERRRLPVRRVAASAFAGLVFVALAACQSGSPSAAPPSPPPSTGSDQQILAIGRDYAQCLRDHGIANFPDMVVVAGRLSLPDNASGDAAEQALRANPAARDACQPILGRLPASAQKNPAMSDADRQNLLRFAQCMREHGVPQWPDPRPDGTFPIAGTPLEREGKSARIQSATAACKQYWDKGIPVK